MDANFCRQSYIVDHLASAIKQDVVICLNRTSSKDLLLSYVIKEFTWQTRLPCIVLSSEGNEKSHNTLKEWLSLFTHLQLKHLETFEENRLSKYDAAFTMSIESFFNNTDIKTFVKDISLLVVDLTNAPVDQESLHRAKKLYDVGKDVNKDFRFVVLLNIHECLTNPLDLKKTLEVCTSTIPLNLKIGSDALVFGSNGNLIKSTLILPDSKTFYQADLYMIKTHLKECGSFLTICHDNELSRKTQFLEIVHSLEFNFEVFGPIAFALSINDCYDALQEKDEHSSHEAKEYIFVDFLKTKFLIMEKLIENSFCREKELSIVTQCLKEALSILETTKHSCLSSGEKFRFAFVVESYQKARILYSTLQELKVTSAYRYLNELSTCIFDETNHDSISKRNNTIILLAANVLSNFKPKLQQNGCVSFKVPNDFEEFLLMKRMLKKTSGILYFVIAPESKKKEEQIKMLHEFERIEEVLLQKMPSYINPEEGLKAELLQKLDSKSIEGVNPKESLSIVNRYCKFLSTGKSTFAVNSEFAFTKDERESKMHGRTFIHMPVKSLLTEPIKGPIITLPCNGYDLNDLRIITRIASSMEACKMLQDASELDGSFMPTRDTRKVKDEYSSRENAALLSCKHWYIKQIPKLLAGSFPKPGQHVYIYVVEDDVTIEAGNILDKKHLGFCTTKRLPNIPSFAIFKHRQKLVLKIKETPGVKILEKSFARPLYEFHFYINDYILEYEKNISNENSVKNGLLWTPLKYDENEYAIDVSYLKSMSFSRDIFMKEGRSNFNFNTVNLTDIVVVPRHREKENALLIVENIRKDIKMSDPFPNESVASSYTDYYQRKYNIELRPDQCMVEVRFKNHDLNLLQRKYPENSEHKTKATHTIIMIPEDLCCVHPIPLHLWNQIDTIPATIYRLASLLLVKELQEMLCNEFFLNEVGLCPVVDDGLDLALNKIHIEKDMSGLQYVEELCNNSSETASNKKSLISIGTEIQDEDAFKDEEGHAKTNLKEDAFSQRNLDSLFSNKVNFDAAIGFKELQPVPTQSNANNEKDREKNRQPGKILLHSMPPLSYLLVAMTTVEANDLYNCERLELVGDAFLSFTISAELFYRNLNEHVMSTQKSNMVSNMTLYEKGNSKKLWKYLVEDHFDYKKNPLISCVFERATPCNVENNSSSLGKEFTLPECTNKLDHVTSNGSGNLVHDMFQSKGTSTRDFILDGNCDTVLSTERPNVHGTERCITAAEQNSSVTDQCTSPPNNKRLNSLLPPNRQDSETFGRFKTAIRNKAIADSVEALIGLFFIFSGESVALSILQWLGYDLKSMVNAREKSRCNMKLKLTKNLNPYQKNFRLKQESDSSNAFRGQDSSPNDAHHSDNASTEYVIAKTNFKNELNEACTETVSYEDGPPITWFSISAPNYRLAELHDFERKINYQFNNIDILAEALLHPSYFRELSFQLHCNQRLEFLGDSVLYLLIIDYLCRKFPMETNADITFMRCIVVSTRTFATISLLNDFQRYIQAFSPEMSYAVKEWAWKIEQEKANGILWPKLTMADVRSYDPFFNKDKTESSSVPKDLADVFESVAGAIYIDSGRIHAVWSSYYVLLKDVLDSLPSPQT